MKTLLVSLVSIFFPMACSDDNSNETCFSFDERQCQTDLWAEGISSGASIEDKEAAVIRYFLDNQIIIKEISSDPTFHEAVCEACHVCPMGPRFYIRMEGVSIQDLESFELLSLEVADCNVIF